MIVVLAPKDYRNYNRYVSGAYHLTPFIIITLDPPLTPQIIVLKITDGRQNLDLKPSLNLKPCKP